MHCNNNEEEMSDSEEQKVDWSKWLLKSAGTGLAAVVVLWLLGERDSVQVMGQSLPVVIPLGAGCAVGSLSADIAHAYVLPMIPHNEKWADMEGSALSVAGSGAGTSVAALLLGFNPNLKTFLVRSASYVGWDFMYHRFLMPGPDGGLY